MQHVKTYTGTKTVQATPMTRGEFGKHRALFAGDDPNAEGYEVTYADGYVSWSPKGVFEAAYKPSGTWQERLLGEYEDLHNRHVLLTEFIASPGFGKVSPVGQNELLSQHTIMAAYASTLGIRIQTAREEGLFDGIDTTPFGI